MAYYIIIKYFTNAIVAHTQADHLFTCRTCGGWTLHFAAGLSAGPLPFWHLLTARVWPSPSLPVAAASSAHLQYSSLAFFYSLASCRGRLP
mmetsp:Transcript_25264/g.49712  ORF Transcript_25264/g.49712 Transcript_25264/m.49712 type:complete len:91 (-) Transcript_25264:2118-2390(-)